MGLTCAAHLTIGLTAERVCNWMFWCYSTSIHIVWYLSTDIHKGIVPTQPFVWVKKTHDHRHQTIHFFLQKKKDAFSQKPDSPHKLSICISVRYNREWNKRGHVKLVMCMPAEPTKQHVSLLIFCFQGGRLFLVLGIFPSVFLDFGYFLNHFSLIVFKKNVWKL